MVAPGTFTCTTCGTVGAQQFCTACGTRRADVTPASTAEAVRPSAPPDPSRCTTCGSAHGGRRFCQTCGTPVATLPPVPVAEETVHGPLLTPYVAPRGAPTAVPLPSAPAQAPAKRGRGGFVAVLVVVLVVVLLVLVAGAGGWLLTRSPEDPAPEQAAQADDSEVSRSAHTPSATGTPSAEPTTPTTSAPAPDPAPPSTAPTTTPQQPKPVLVECWKGRKRPSADLCPTLTGYAAIEWVFYGVDLSRCDRHRDPARIYVQCRSASGELLYNFSQWYGRGTGNRHYDTTPGGPSYGISGGRLRWDSAPGEAPKSAFMYAGLPWGMTVYGDTVAERDARAGQVHMRLVRTVRSFS